MRKGVNGIWTGIIHLIVNVQVLTPIIQVYTFGAMKAAITAI